MRDDDAIHNMFWQPNDLHQGSPVFITVELDKPATRVNGNFVNKPFSFFHEEGNTKVWHALAGVDLQSTPASTAWMSRQRSRGPYREEVHAGQRRRW